MMSDYQTFLAGKAPRAQSVGVEPEAMPEHLFDYQGYCTEFFIRLGRTACFEDTGLGKTVQELEFGRQAARATNKPTLILTPLAVARQIEQEGLRFGYECRVIREPHQVSSGINICNYDRLDKLDTGVFGAVILDESSVLKSFTGATTRALIKSFSNTRFKLCATATPAPNDHMELGQHAEFLGVMASNEMLARWFISDQTEMGRYRLKRYGEESFWDWMASWARMAETPADLGFDASRFKLPPLNIIRHKSVGEVKPPVGTLFVQDVSATNIHNLKRQTATARAEVVAQTVDAEKDRQWIVWCDSNYEADALLKAIGGDAREVRGSHKTELKEERLAAFASGDIRVLISKPSICGYGLNWQHCARMAFVGRSFSYESWYQAIRRCWRFGQKQAVNVHLIVAEGEDQIGRVIDRKAEDHAAMKRAMADAMRRDRARSSQVKIPYNPIHIGRTPPWLISAA